MKKYNVKMTVKQTYIMDFDAENTDAAEELAMDEYNTGRLDDVAGNVEFTFDRVMEVADDGTD
tara:strand:+ start:250 stop:438 length:189 start_codon:yes stop_codon:yes gene_type:complete